MYSAIEKSGNLIRKRLSQMASKNVSKGSVGRVTKGTAKKTQNDVNMLKINNPIARS